MKNLLTLTCILLFTVVYGQNSLGTTSFYDFEVKDIYGETFKFSSLKGKKVMIVNTASKCGYTPQFEGLQTLYAKNKENNFVIIGFPTNDFMKQDPGTNEEIAEFCKFNYGVEFPMMEKIVVKGENKHPLYTYLLAQSGAKEIGWNFEKILINENGFVVMKYASNVDPNNNEIRGWIDGSVSFNMQK